MTVFGIDPGTRESAYVEILGGGLTCHAIFPNGEVVKVLRANDYAETIVVCEMPQYYGKDSSAGMETFETCVAVGRFMEAVEARGGSFERISRPRIRAQICGTTNSSDKEVRQALIDRFGGDSAALRGKKCPRCKGTRACAKDTRHSFNPRCEKCASTGWERKPGPLAGISSHMWSALAVAVAWAELHPEEGGGR